MLNEHFNECRAIELTIEQFRGVTKNMPENVDLIEPCDNPIYERLRILALYNLGIAQVPDNATKAKLDYAHAVMNNRDAFYNNGWFEQWIDEDSHGLRNMKYDTILDFHIAMLPLLGLRDSAMADNDAFALAHGWEHAKKIMDEIEKFSRIA